MVCARVRAAAGAIPGGGRMDRVRKLSGGLDLCADCCVCMCQSVACRVALGPAVLCVLGPLGGPGCGVCRLAGGCALSGPRTRMLAW